MKAGRKVDSYATQLTWEFMDQKDSVLMLQLRASESENLLCISQKWKIAHMLHVIRMCGLEEFYSKGSKGGRICRSRTETGSSTKNTPQGTRVVEWQSEETQSAKGIDPFQWKGLTAHSGALTRRWCDASETFISEVRRMIKGSQTLAWLSGPSEAWRRSSWRRGRGKEEARCHNV